MTETTIDTHNQEPPTSQDSYEPMAADANLVETLLRKPSSLIHELLHGQRSNQLTRTMLLCSLLCLLTFGCIAGTFSLGNQLWAAPIKIIFGFFFTAFICLPSFYIFACLTGMRIKFSDIVKILIALICLTSLLLVGFAPVVLIFSQSTESLHFVGALNIAFWIISLGFGLQLLNKLIKHCGGHGDFHLRVWMVIFVLVGFQMSTSLRPIIGSSAYFLTGEKKFFLQHWINPTDKRWEIDRNR